MLRYGRQLPLTSGQRLRRGTQTLACVLSADTHFQVLQSTGEQMTISLNKIIWTQFSRVQGEIWEVSEMICGHQLFQLQSCGLQRASRSPHTCVLFSSKSQLEGSNSQQKHMAEGHMELHVGVQRPLFLHCPFQMSVIKTHTQVPTEQLRWFKYQGEFDKLVEFAKIGKAIPGYTAKCKKYKCILTFWIIMCFHDNWLLEYFISNNYSELQWQQGDINTN